MHTFVQYSTRDHVAEACARPARGRADEWAPWAPVSLVEKTSRDAGPAGCGRPGPALGGPPRYRFYVLRVTGPFLRSYNGPNDRALAPSAGGVEYKHQVAGSHRYWPLASLQSAQSAAGALVVVRGGQHSRPCALPQCCSRCITQLPYVQAR